MVLVALGGATMLLCGFLLRDCWGGAETVEPGASAAAPSSANPSTAASGSSQSSPAPSATIVARSKGSKLPYSLAFVHQAALFERVLDTTSWKHSYRWTYAVRAKADAEEFPIRFIEEFPYSKELESWFVPEPQVREGQHFLIPLAIGPNGGATVTTGVTFVQDKANAKRLYGLTLKDDELAIAYPNKEDDIGEFIASILVSGYAELLASARCTVPPDDDKSCHESLEAPGAQAEESEGMTHIWDHPLPRGATAIVLLRVLASQRAQQPQEAGDSSSGAQPETLEVDCDDCSETTELGPICLSSKTYRIDPVGLTKPCHKKVEERLKAASCLTDGVVKVRCANAVGAEPPPAHLGPR